MLTNINKNDLNCDREIKFQFWKTQSWIYQNLSHTKTYKAIVAALYII